MGRRGRCLQAARRYWIGDRHDKAAEKFCLLWRQFRFGAVHQFSRTGKLKCSVCSQANELNVIAHQRPAAQDVD